MEEYVPYRAYLIRVWPTERGGKGGCRVSLQNVTSGERENFADLEGLLAYLETQRLECENPGQEEATASGGGKEALA
jgi:hypothetical protein